MTFPVEVPQLCCTALVSFWPIAAVTALRKDVGS